MMQRSVSSTTVAKDAGGRGLALRSGGVGITRGGRNRYLRYMSCNEEEINEDLAHSVSRMT